MSSGSTSPATPSTRDKVIRREFRLNEGDAFNALKVKRSQDRIQSLGFFQDKLEIKQTEGSAPDRVVLGVNVEEKPTGQLSLSGGYSSLERFVVQLAVSQNNFMGKGQTLDASVNWSVYSKSVEVGLHRSLFPRQADPVRRAAVPPRLQQLQFHRQQPQHDLFAGQHRRRAPASASRSPNIGASAAATRCSQDKISLDKATFFTDPDGTGPLPASAIRSRPAAICATKSARG